MVRMPHWPIPPWHTIKYDLTRISSLCQLLGNPELKFSPAIHIAGTNGKGSSLSMLRSIFEAAGYKVHAYTSPHLIEFNERIVIAGEKISDHYLFQVCEQVRIVSEANNIEPSFFEGTTAAAFLAFADVKADILLLETGLGGRLDATNILQQPLLTIITPISYDHMEYLGPTLPIIAGEKAGIIKQNTPCIISAQTDEVYQVLLTKCAELNAPSLCYEYDFGIEKTAKGFIYRSKNYNFEFPMPALLGDHQLINAAAVIAAISAVNQQFKIGANYIIQGLENVKWPARIEKIEYDKYKHLATENTRIWLDGAHNSGGAQVLVNWIKDNLYEPVYLILGMTKNRNIEDFCLYFKDIIVSGYGVRVLSEPSSYSAEILTQRAASTGIDFQSALNLEEAIRDISNNTSVVNIIICGSLFLAADFYKIIG